METDLIKRAYLESKIVMKGDYPYFVNSISDGNPAVTRELLDEIVGGFQRLSNLDCDIFLAPEAMGIPIAAALTMRTGKPFQIIRKRKSGIPGEIVFERTTGYDQMNMYLQSVSPGTKVILVDDVISTGNTLKKSVQTIRDAGMVIEEVLIVLNKSIDLDALEKEAGVRVHSIIDVAVVDGKPVIKDSTHE
jgi:adenine phosphoribosyltransferase